MTPPQLRAFVSIVRKGSVKGAAEALGLTESAVSMHVAQLRKELGDQLFTRTSSGIAFTPGGLRLASGAVELLGLQEQTIAEIGQASAGQRVLRVGATSLFAEHAAPGLIALFTQRADDLEVELSVHQAEEFEGLLAGRAIDVAIGPASAPTPNTVQRPFLAYDVQVVAAPGHPLTTRPASRAELAESLWYLGPAAIGPAGAVPGMLHDLGVPEENQRIFQSEAAAVEETMRSVALDAAVVFAVSADLKAKRLVPVQGPGTRRRGMWTATMLAGDGVSPASELLRFLVTPRAIQAMLRGSGVPIKRFRPSVYVTLWQ